VIIRINLNAALLLISFISKTRW